MHLIFWLSALSLLTSPLAHACEHGLDPALLRASIARGEWDSPFFNFEADLRSSSRGFTVLGYENIRETLTRDYFLRSGWADQLPILKHHLDKEVQQGRLALTNGTYSGTILGQTMSISLSLKAEDDMSLTIEGGETDDQGEKIRRRAGFVYRTDLHEAARRWEAQHGSRRPTDFEGLAAYVDTQLKPVSIDTIPDLHTLSWVHSLLTSLITPPEQAAAVTNGILNSWEALNMRYLSLGAQIPLRAAILRLAERRTSRRAEGLLRVYTAQYDLTLEEPGPDAHSVKIWIHSQSLYDRPHPIEAFTLPLTPQGIFSAGTHGPSSTLLPEIYRVILSASRPRN